MNKLTIKYHDVETGAEIQREMNAQELAERQIRQVADAELVAAQTQKASDKAALLAKLGITEDEARLLLS